MHDTRRLFDPSFLLLPLEQLLVSLLDIGPLRLTLCHVDLTAEVWGDAHLYVETDWLTIVIGERLNRLHVRRAALRRAQFIDVWGMEKAVHFVDDAERLVLRSVLVDTAEGASYAPVRLAAFLALQRQYGEEMPLQ